MSIYSIYLYIYTSTQNHSKVYLCIRSRQSSAWRSRLGSQFVEPQSRQILGQNPRWVKGHWRILQHDIHNVNVWAKKKASVGINTSMNMYIYNTLYNTLYYVTWFFTLRLCMPSDMRSGYQWLHQGLNSGSHPAFGELRLVKVPGPNGLSVTGRCYVWGAQNTVG